LQQREPTSINDRQKRPQDFFISSSLGQVRTGRPPSVIAPKWPVGQMSQTRWLGPGFAGKMQ
jgi:hypothetical protein